MSIFDFLYDKTKKSERLIVDNYNQLRVKEFWNNVLKYEECLKKRGVYPNSVLGILIDNRTEFFTILLAANKIGAIVVPIYVKTGFDKLKQMIQDYDIQFIVTNIKFEGINNITTSIIDETVYLCVLVQSNQKKWKLDDAAFIMQTSGTTGIPKGVLITNDNVITSILNISSYLDLSETDSVFILKSVAHVSTIIGEFFYSIYCGSKIFLSNRLITSEYVSKKIYEHEISVVFVTPSLLREFIRNPLSKCNSLRIIHTVGEMLPFEIAEQAHELYPTVNIISGYGLTEASPRVAQIDYNALCHRKGAVGKPLGDQIVRIVNDGILCSFYTIGEVVIRGKNIVKGYLVKNKVTCLENGWLYTGDLGYMDNEGYLYILGRKDNMFTINGRNIFPEEIERVLLSFEGVYHAIVYKEHGNMFDYVCAKVSCDVQLNDLELMKHCKRLLEDYKVPKKIQFCDSLDVTLSGKIKRK